MPVRICAYMKERVVVDNAVVGFSVRTNARIDGFGAVVWISSTPPRGFVGPDVGHPPPWPQCPPRQWRPPL